MPAQGPYSFPQPYSAADQVRHFRLQVNAMASCARSPNPAINKIMVITLRHIVVRIANTPEKFSRTLNDDMLV